MRFLAPSWPICLAKRPMRGVVALPVAGKMGRSGAAGLCPPSRGISCTLEVAISVDSFERCGKDRSSKKARMRDGEATARPKEHAVVIFFLYGCEVIVAACRCEIPRIMPHHATRHDPPRRVGRRNVVFLHLAADGTPPHPTRYAKRQRHKAKVL